MKFARGLEGIQDYANLFWVTSVRFWVGVRYRGAARFGGSILSQSPPRFRVMPPNHLVPQPFSEDFAFTYNSRVRIGWESPYFLRTHSPSREPRQHSLFPSRLKPLLVCQASCSMCTNQKIGGSGEVRVRICARNLKKKKYSNHLALLRRDVSRTGLSWCHMENGCFFDRLITSCTTMTGEEE